jgi:hypothetical protein
MADAVLSADLQSGISVPGDTAETGAVRIARHSKRSRLPRKDVRLEEMPGAPAWAIASDDVCVTTEVFL